MKEDGPASLAGVMDSQRGVMHSQGGVVATLGELVALGARVPQLGADRPRRSVRPGQQRGLAAGSGMEFHEARPYQPGDDVRAVDWRQTARRGRLYTKLYQEEVERPLHILADLGPTMRFGTRGAFKSVQGARAAAWLAWSALAAGNPVGGTVWDGSREWLVRPQGQRPGVLALLERIAACSAALPGREHSLSLSLANLLNRRRPGTRVAVISDFAGLDGALEQGLKALARAGQLILIHVFDPFEAEAPPPGTYALTDGLRRLALDLGSAEARAAHIAPFARRREALARLAAGSGTALVPLGTAMDPAAVLARALGLPVIPP